jgi:hypothetical protein
MTTAIANATVFALYLIAAHGIIEFARFAIRTVHAWRSSWQR